MVCRKLEELGAAAVMPLGAPIGSGMGIRNPANLRIILEQAKVPVIVDAGVGTASDAALAMELGAHGVLMNTAIAEAQDPVRMAEGHEARRRSRLARRPRRPHPPEALRLRLLPADRPHRMKRLQPPAGRTKLSSPHSRPRAAIAQLDRATDYGSVGWGFDSSWLHHF